MALRGSPRRAFLWERRRGLPLGRIWAVQGVVLLGDICVGAALLRRRAPIARPRRGGLRDIRRSSSTRRRGLVLRAVPGDTRGGGARGPRCRRARPPSLSQSRSAGPGTYKKAKGIDAAILAAAAPNNICLINSSFWSPAIAKTALAASEPVMAAAAFIRL